MTIAINSKKFFNLAGDLLNNWSMTSKSKVKGNSFEREVASFLTEQYGQPFVRVVNSGAYVGGSNTHRKSKLTENQVKSFKGDITPPDDWTKFNAEAKSYGDFAFNLLFTDSSQLDKWLAQLLEVHDEGDMNVLFFKISRKGRFVAVQANHPWTTDCHHLVYRSSMLGDWMIYSFENFFKFNSDLFKQLSK